MKVFNYLLTAALAINLTQANAQCTVNGSHYTANYSSGWNYYDSGDGAAVTSASCNDNKNGSLYSAGSAAFFFSARCSRELRITSTIPVVSDQNWTMDFTLQITTNAGILQSNSPAVALASLTADPISLFTSCSTPGVDFCTTCPGGYPATNTDAIWVELLGDPPGTNCQEPQATRNWRIIAHARDGNGTPINSTPIPITSGGTGTYYIRLQRTGSTSGTISVCSNSTYQTHLSGSPQCFSIPAGVSGLDALSHEMLPQGVCYRVFNGIVSNLKIDNSVIPCTSLTSSFTAPSSVCDGESFVVNGSASSPSTGMPINTHQWIVQECDQFGNHFGPAWYSPGINGAPNADYPIIPTTVATAGVNMVCNHYYKVSLVVMNCANPWTVSSKIVTIKCKPTISMYGSQKVCKDDNGAIAINATGGSGNITMEINPASPWGPNLYSGPPPATVLIYPTTTTMYHVRAMDNITGCQTDALWNVDLVDADPTFSVTVSPYIAGYFKVSAIANDLNSNSVSGFTSDYYIEELNASNTPYYPAHTSSNCWQNYPNAETFMGFTATPGSFSQATCGSIGKFQYNHTYRITRVTVNDYCSPKQYSVKFTPVKSGNGTSMEVTEDTDAPDMTHLFSNSKTITREDHFSIFPNPSEGIFTIDLGGETTGSTIEVKDALGKTVKSFEQKELQTELNMTGYTKGIYFVTVTKNGSSITKKIILE